MLSSKKGDNIIVEKTFSFSLLIISLFKKLQQEKEYVISNQIIRSGTSIGANVEEALAGQSKKDFVHKLSIASKEARETRYWLRLLQESDITVINVQEHLVEIEHIINIITKIIITSNQNLNKNL